MKVTDILGPGIITEARRRRPKLKATGATVPDHAKRNMGAKFGSVNKGGAQQPKKGKGSYRRQKRVDY